MSEAVDTLENNSGDGGQKGGIGQFVRETREELKKVSFPSTDDVRGTTIIVILNVIFFAIFLFLVDQGWVYFLQAIEWVVNKIVGI